MVETKFKFTQSSLSQLPVPERRTYYGDTGTRGLFVAALPSGLKTFYVVRKVDGRPVRVLLGRFDPDLPGSRELPSGTDPLALVGHVAALNHKMARALAAAVNVQLDRGVNPATEHRTRRKAADEELTLRQAFERYYYDHLIPHGKRTAEALREDFNRYLGTVAPGQKKPHGKEKSKAPGAVDWETRKLSGIHPGEVRRMMTGLKDGVGPRTANKAFILLRAIYRKAKEWRLYAGDNPCEGIPKFPERERSRFLRSDELPAFFEALANCQHEAFRHFVLLSLATGARKGNLLGMRWADLDFAAGLWTVPSEKSKNGDLLTIPLTAVALEVLGARPRDGEWVFPARSASGHMEDPQRLWDALLKTAGLKDVWLHDLRRSLGSWSAMTGASMAIIGRALGHKSSEATRIYARFQTNPVKDAMERAQAAMFAHGRAMESGEVITLSTAKRK